MERYHESLKNLTPADVYFGRGHTILDGRILAVVTRADEFSTEHFAYLKRLGKAMPRLQNVYYLENVGQTGEGEFVQFPRSGIAPTDGIPIVDQTWQVLERVDIQDSGTAENLIQSPFWREFSAGQCSFDLEGSSVGADGALFAGQKQRSGQDG